MKEAMKDISKNFPEGLEYNFPFDMTEYISQSVHEVYKTLFEALFLGRSRSVPSRYRIGVRL